MGEIALRAQGLSKRYSIERVRAHRESLRDVLAEALARPFRHAGAILTGSSARDSSPVAAPSSPGAFWALSDVSFEITRGTAVGVIGRNGAGKTTLLRILSRISRPTTGWAEVHGRLGTLLHLGTGFQRDLTGRDNVYFSGAVLGMRKAEIDAKFDEIVAFAEVGQFIDTPIKRYSSGMHMRLAFAVAAHLQAEVLIVDEVLAVGDLAFQKKCLDKMAAVAREGRTVLLVSHDMAAIEHLCGEAMLFDGGRLMCHGGSRSVIDRFLQTVHPADALRVPLPERRDRNGDGRVRLTAFHLETAAGDRLAVARCGLDVVLVFGFRCRAGVDPRDVDVGFSIRSSTDHLLFAIYASYTGRTFERVPATGTFRCRVPRLPLLPGRYLVEARVTVGGVEADSPIAGVGYLNVVAGDFYGSGGGSPGHANGGGEESTPLLVDGRWEVEAG